MKNVFEDFNDEKFKFFNQLKNKSELNEKIIFDEIDRFYPNIKELRKLQNKKKPKKNLNLIRLRKLVDKQNKTRLIRSSSDKMILNFLTKKKEEFNSFCKKNESESLLNISSIKGHRNIKQKKNSENFFISKSKIILKNNLSKNSEKISNNISKNKYFPNFIKYDDFITKFKRKNNPRNNYSYIKSHLYDSNSIMNIRTKKNSKIFEKVKNMSYNSKKVYQGIKEKLNDLKFENKNNINYNFKYSQKLKVLNEMKEVEKSIDYKKENFI